MIIYIGCFVLSLAFLYLLYAPCRLLTSIPAPPGVPLFGNMFQLSSEKGFVQMFKWAKNFPNGIMRIRLGLQNIVVVNNYELIHQVLVGNGKAYANRAQTFRLGLLTDNFSNISFMPYNSTHRLMKKVFIGHVKAYGSGLENIQKVVLNATSEFIKHVESEQGRPCDIRQYIQNAVVDMIHILALKRRSSSKEREEINNLIGVGYELAAVGGIGELFDRIKLLQIFGTPFWRTLNKLINLRKSICDTWLHEHFSESHSDKDTLISKLSKHSKEGIERKHIVQVLVNDTFGAGTTTTSSTLSTLINIMVHKPEIQQRLYNECDQVLHKRNVTLEDQAKMPYLQATVLETLRYSSIVPFTLPHETTQETRLAGHTLPKGTQVWVNTWALHHDEDFWDEPFEFIPERYLDTDGQLVLADHPNRTHTMAFGAGVRVCAGEVFARSRLFLMLASIVQNFEILPETTISKQPSCDCRDMIEGMPMFPPQYKARFLPRDE